MRIDIISAVPELVEAPLKLSIIGRAVASGHVDIRVVDLHDFSHDKHRKIDDYPYGGGGGMVIKPEPVFEAVDHIKAEVEAEGIPFGEVVFLTPDGEQFSQSIANQMSLSRHLVLIAGHYKGIDERVRENLVTKEISIGDFVLSGGELPALIVVDTLVRLIPGALGDAASALSDSFQDGLLGAPAYTRPPEYRGMAVPDVLLSGDHKRITEWKEKERLERTKQKRPDLLD